MARLCRVAGCYNIIDDSDVFCSNHIREAKERQEERQKAIRKPYATAESYNAEYYQTSRWRKLSLKIRTANPQCCMCGSPNNLSVHHTIEGPLPEELFFDESICVVLCRKCHMTVTQRHSVELRRK